MTPAQTVAVIAYAGSLDGRIRNVDEETARLRVQAWHRMLGPDGDDLPYLFARDKVLAYYSNEANTAPLGIAWLLAQWRARLAELDRQDEQARRERRRAEPEQVSAAALPGAPPWFRDAVAAGNAAAGKVRAQYPNQLLPPRVMTAAIEDAVEHLIPEPGPMTAEEKAADFEERKCRYWRECACDHVECRDGWMDGDLVIKHRGREYVAVKRCRHCEDTLKMRAGN